MTLKNLIAVLKRFPKNAEVEKITLNEIVAVDKDVKFRICLSEPAKVPEEK